MNNVEWTDEQVADLKELWGRGVSARVIAIKLGRSRKGVIGKVDRLGLIERCPNNARRKLWTDEDVSQFKELWNAGVSARKIGAQLKRAHGGIIDKAKQLGLATRPQPQRKKRRGTLISRSPWFPKAPPLATEQKGYGRVLSLSDLEPHHCRWPWNDIQKGGEYFFCGETKIEDKGIWYCPYHRDVAMLGTELADRKREAA